MAKEELKCDSLIENLKEKKSAPEPPAPSIWSCITGVSKWTDIIKQASKVNKTTKNKNLRFNTLKEKKKTTASSKKSHPQIPKTYCSESGNVIELKNEIKHPTLLKLDENVNCDVKNTDKIVSKKIIQYNKPTIHRTIKRQVYKSSSQEVNGKHNREKQNIHWIQNVSVHEFYKVEELIGDKNSKCEHQGTTKRIPTDAKNIRDEKTRIIVLLLQKIKKLEIQMRDLQFLSLKKKFPQNSNKKIKNVSVIPLRPVIKPNDNKFKPLNLLKFNENADLPINSKTPILTLGRRNLIKPETENKPAESIRPKRKRKSLRNAGRHEYNNNRNQIDGGIAGSILRSVKTENVGLPNHYCRNTDRSDQATLWLLFNRIRSLETQIKLLDKSTNNQSKNRNINLKQRNIAPKQIRQEINKSKCKKLLGRNMILEKSGNYKNDDVFELYFPPKKKKKVYTKLNDAYNIQRKKLSTIYSIDANNDSRDNDNIFNIVKEVTSEKITQTSKQYFTSLSKTEITGDNCQRLSSTTEIDTDIEIPTKDNEYRKSSILIATTYKSETKPEKETVEDEKLIKMKKEKYSCTTISTQKTSRYEDEDETTGCIYDSETTDQVLCKTTTEDEYDSEITTKGRNLKNAKDKNKAMNNFSSDTKNDKNKRRNNQDCSSNKSNKFDIYDFITKKSYIPAKERQKIDEDLKKQQREIFRKLLRRNINYKSSFSAINKNSLPNVQLALQTANRSTTSSAESGDGIMNTKPEFNFLNPLSQVTKPLLSSYHNIKNPDSKIFSPEFLTPQLQTSNIKIEKNNYILNKPINAAARSEIVCPIITDIPLRNWYKEHLMRQNVRWRSLTSIPAISKEFVKELHEIKNNTIENNSKAIKKKIGDTIIKNIGCKENNSDILMNVIQLSPSNGPIANVSNAYLVLVNSETSNAQSTFDEEKIKEIILSLKNSVDNFKQKGSHHSLTEKYNNESVILKFNTICSKEKKETDDECSTVSVSNTNKSNKSDSHVIIKSNATKKSNRSDSRMLVKRSSSPKTNEKKEEEKTKESATTKKIVPSKSKAMLKAKSKVVIKTNSDSKNTKMKKKSCSDDVNKCQCVITGTNVCFPPLNYIDYNLSRTHISITETDKCMPNINKQQSMKRKSKNLIIRLQKEIELQRKEVHELKNIWSKCSSRLEDIWRSNTQQNIDLESQSNNNKSTTSNQLCNLPQQESSLINKSMEDELTKKYILKNNVDERSNNSNNKDGNKINKNNIIHAFEILAESSLLLSGILAEAKESQNRISTTELSSSDFSFNQQPLEGDKHSNNKSYKIVNLKSQNRFNIFRNDEISRRKLKSVKRNSPSLPGSDTNSSSSDSDGNSCLIKVRSKTSEKSTQTCSSRSRNKRQTNGKNALIRVQKLTMKNKSKSVCYNSGSSAQIIPDDNHTSSGTIENNKVLKKEKSKEKAVSKSSIQ